MDYYEIPSISEIVPGLLIGNAMCTYDLPTLQSNHINAVVSLVNAPLNLWNRAKFTDSVTIGRHLWIECVDSSTFDMLVHLDRICEFIDQMLSFDQPYSPQDSFQPDSSKFAPFQQVPDIDIDVKTTSSQPLGVVLVHCDLGISRSATAVIAYLMRKQHRTRDDVLAEVRAKRKRTKPSANFMDQLKVWEQVEYQIWEDRAKTMPKNEYAAYRERRAAALQAKGLTGNEPMRLLEL